MRRGLTPAERRLYIKEQLDQIMSNHNQSGEQLAETLNETLRELTSHEKSQSVEYVQMYFHCFHFSVAEQVVEFGICNELIRQDIHSLEVSDIIEVWSNETQATPYFHDSFGVIDDRFYITTGKEWRSVLTYAIERACRLEDRLDAT